MGVDASIMMMLLLLLLHALRAQAARGWLAVSTRLYHMFMTPPDSWEGMRNLHTHTHAADRPTDQQRTIKMAAHACSRRLRMRTGHQLQLPTALMC